MLYFYELCFLFVWIFNSEKLPSSVDFVCMISLILGVKNILYFSLLIIFTWFMDYIHMLVVHNRGVYNFMGMILVAQVFFFFFAFMHSLHKISFRFWSFPNRTVMNEISIKKALNANECVRWIETFIANLGHPLWGSQSMQQLASLMRRGRKFLIPDANSCIDCEPHTFLKDVQDLQWMPQFILHTHLHLVLSLWKSQSLQ